MTPDQFIKKWAASDLSERSAAQQHFLDLCALLGEPTPAEADPTADSYTFEKGGTTVLFVGPDCAWSTEWVDHALARVKGLKSKDNPVRVVFAADPTTLRVVLHDGLTDEVDVVSLEPWTDDFLKEWLQETNQASDASVRKAILEQSGGWAEFIHESHGSDGKGIDALGEAKRRLERLGIEDPQALSLLDAKPIEEIRSGAHGEAPGRLLRWAELLGLARVRRGGSGATAPINLTRS